MTSGDMRSVEFSVPYDPGRKGRLICFELAFGWKRVLYVDWWRTKLGLS